MSQHVRKNIQEYIHTHIHLQKYIYIYIHNIYTSIKQNDKPQNRTNV